ncbi:MAG: DUF1016 N-terminal domain-containing protein, partial [Spirosomaceae bacterium]|nr:DUF1016 N-terminal domain-containing protein [Spirosomataceae bacterium]
MKIEQNTHSQYIADIKAILAAAKQQVYSAVNTAMVQAYWLIGKRIVEQEQHGKERAEYGSFLIKNLAEELTNEFGKGFSEQSLKNFRQFYVVFNDLPISSTIWNELPTQKGSTLWSQLSWSHFKALMRVTNPEARAYYLKETAENNWSVRTLDRNIATQYYER